MCTYDASGEHEDRGQAVESGHNEVGYRVYARGDESDDSDEDAEGADESRKCCRCRDGAGTLPFCSRDGQTEDDDGHDELKTPREVGGEHFG